MLLRKFSTALLIIQIALTVALIVNTQVLTNEAVKKIEEPLGFDAANLVMSIQKPTTQVFEDKDFATNIIKTDLNKLVSSSQVSNAAYFGQVPVGQDSWLVNIQDINLPRGAILPPELNAVPLIPVYGPAFEVMGIELVQGRYLNQTDDTSLLESNRMSAQNIVITESLAKALYPDETALGRKTNMGTVVGVIEDYQVNPTWDGNKKYFALFSYTIFSKVSSERHYLIESVSNDLGSTIEHAKELIISVHPERDIYDSFTMQERVTNLFERETALANLFWFLSILMVLVTAISSFSHAHFHISRQKKIIGIRRAVGARKIDILLLVFTESWLLYGIGCIFGMVALVVVNAGLSNIIDIARPGIIEVFIGISVIFISGSLATWIPAMKTVKIPPIIAAKAI